MPTDHRAQTGKLVVDHLRGQQRLTDARRDHRREEPVMSASRAGADPLRWGAGRFDELAGQADRVVEVLGACWGQDEVGRGLADEHVEEAGGALHDPGELPARLRAVGAGFAEAPARRRASAADAEELGRNTGQG